MESTINIGKSQQYKSSRNPNFRKQVENYEKNKMHSLAISVMNLISLFNSSSNENNNNISSMNVLSKIKSINDSEINKDEINDENNYDYYMEQIGGNIDKGRMSQNMISNNNNYPGRPILEKYNYYYKQLKGENALEETAFQNSNNNNNDNIGNINNKNNNKKIINTSYINDNNNNNGYNDNFDDNKNINPLQGKLRNNNNNYYNDNNNFNNDDDKNYNNNFNNNYNNYDNNNDNFNNNDHNNFNNSNQTIIQFNDYMIRSNNSNKYSGNQ